MAATAVLVSDFVSLEGHKNDYKIELMGFRNCRKLLPVKRMQGNLINSSV